MKFKLNRGVTAVILLVVAVLLLVTYLFLNYLINSEEPVSVKTVLNSSQIDSLFIYSLNSFGLSQDWIKEVQNRKTDKSYIVRLPNDLSIPVVLAEINTNFFGKNLTFSSVEKDFSGRTRLTINRGEKIILSAELKYDKEIFRTKRTLSFIIKDFELSGSEDSLLLEIPEPFTALLKPSTKNTKLVNYINEIGKTYSLLIDDDIPDLKYRLNESYPQKRLKASLHSITKDFSYASFFLIDDKSDLFASPTFDFIKLEMEKRKISLVLLSEMQQLNYDDQIQIMKSFDNYVKEIAEGENMLFLLSADGFRILLPEIERYRKTGVKIVHPTKIKADSDTAD
ncbi:MAG: hypothetical protein JSW63_08660 [Ignavibacterium sp.]|nr:MAG: hypothetical protein JSW63_08660 [Ignavibacterium sp.]